MARRGYDDFDDGYDDDLDAGGYDRDYPSQNGRYGGYEDNYESDGYSDEFEGSYYDDYEGGYDDNYDDDYYFDEEDDEERVTNRSSHKKSSGGRKKSGNKKRRIVLIAVELVVLAAVLVILYLVTRVEKVEKVNLETEDLESNISEVVKEDAETGAMQGYRNIVFFGVDSTEGELTQNTRTDAIMICSINEDTGEVKLISVYRDTLLNVGDDSYNKCNSAYAKGGAEQAINMLNSNLDLNITDFVTVGFGGLTDVIDALGGITLTIEEDEISHLNNYQSTMAEELGMDGYTEVTEAGTQTVNGLQATAYCRIRYTTGWDYKRAARQRAVIYAIMDEAQDMSVSELTEIVNTVTDEIYTSYDVDDLIADVSAIANYEMVEEEDIDDMQNGFPLEDYRIQANLGSALGDCVVPRSLTDNVIWLHEFLFEDEDYEVSETVQEYSDYIDEMTADAEAEEMTDEDHT